MGVTSRPASQVPTDDTLPTPGRKQPLVPHTAGRLPAGAARLPLPPQEVPVGALGGGGAQLGQGLGLR